MGYSGGSHRFNFGVVIDGGCNPSSLAFRIGAGPFHARKNEANGSAEANGIDRGRDSTGLFAYLWLDFFPLCALASANFYAFPASLLVIPIAWVLRGMNCWVCSTES